MTQDKEQTQIQEAGSKERTVAVAKSTAMMSAATLMSRITGFLRTWACAFALGNTLLTSAYQVANNMPNMLYELVAGGVLSTAFLPVLMSQIRKSEQDGERFANSLINLCIIVLGVLALAATIFAPQVIATQTFTNVHGDVAQQAVFFFRFFAIQVIFYGVGAILNGVLNAHRKFLMPALGPVFNNLCVIVAMFLYVPLSQSNPTLAMVLLAVLTSLGVAVQCLVQIPALRGIGFKWRPVLSLKDQALKETAKLAIPAIVFTAMNLICVSCKNAFALGASDIGPSTLSYAWLWFQLPYGVLAVSLSTAMFTEMSESAADNDMDRYRNSVAKGLSGTFFMIIPMAVALFVLAPYLTALYHAGQFTEEDIFSVASALRIWAICLPFYASYLYLYFAFSARKRLVVVTVVNVFISLIQIAGYAVLTGGTPLMEGFGVLGIPLTDVVFFTLMYFALFILLRREVGQFSRGGEIIKMFLKATVAGIAGGVVMVLLTGLIGQGTSIITALWQIIVIGAIGLTVMLGLCKLMRVEEVSLFTGLFRRITRKLRRR